MLQTGKERNFSLLKLGSNFALPSFTCLLSSSSPPPHLPSSLSYITIFIFTKGRGRRKGREPLKRFLSIFHLLLPSLTLGNTFQDIALKLYLWARFCGHHHHLWPSCYPQPHYYHKYQEGETSINLWYIQWMLCMMTRLFKPSSVRTLWYFWYFACLSLFPTRMSKGIIYKLCELMFPWLVPSPLLMHN